VQNEFYAMVKENYPAQQKQALEHDELAARWVALFTAIGEQLAVAVE